MRVDKRAIKKALQQVGTMAKEKSPVILTGCGIAGFVTTVIFAVKATPKATKAIECAQSYKEEKLTKTEVVKAAWKFYIPTVAMGAVSTACIIGGQSVNLRRNATLAGLYSISESKLKDYQDAIVETVGEKKAEAIDNKVDEKRLEKFPVNDDRIMLTGKGNTLFFEPMTGRYFRSDPEYVRHCVNDLNQAITLGDGSASLNDFFYYLGLDQATLADGVGWTNERLLEINVFGSAVASNDEPCLVLNYKCDPTYARDYAYLG